VPGFRGLQVHDDQLAAVARGFARLPAPCQRVKPSLACATPSNVTSGAVCTHSLQNILQQHARTFVGDGQGAEEELVGGGDAEAAAQHDDQVGTAVFYQPGGRGNVWCAYQQVTPRAPVKS
jgi:hypothetical protein